MRQSRAGFPDLRVVADALLAVVVVLAAAVVSKAGAVLCWRPVRRRWLLNMEGAIHLNPRL
jgi:hypothetical protein